MANRFEELIAEILALPENDRQHLARVLYLRGGAGQVREAAMLYLNDDSQGRSAMKSVLVRLPDDLATEAQAAGLLGDKPLEELIRRALSEQGGSHASSGRTGARPSRLPVYRGTSGLAKGIDPSSNRSMLDAAGDDT